jgi:four helix bundle protein
MLFRCPRVYHSSRMGFEYRRLLVYEKVLAYRALAAPLLVRIKLVDVDLHNQLKRNGNSIGSNVAEGASEDRPKVKADRYRVSKREAEEAAMNWESAAASGYLNARHIEPLLVLLDEIVRMLGGLIRRFDPHGTPKRLDVEQQPSPNPIPNPIPSS